jgi:hypothetical protein
MSAISSDDTPEATSPSSTRFARCSRGRRASSHLSREDTQRQTHDVHDRKGTRDFAADPKQKVSLDHGDRGGEPYQDRGSETGRMAMRAEVKTKKRTGSDCEDQSQPDFRAAEL